MQFFKDGFPVLIFMQISTLKAAVRYSVGQGLAPAAEKICVFITAMAYNRLKIMHKYRLPCVKGAVVIYDD